MKADSYIGAGVFAAVGAWAVTWLDQGLFFVGHSWLWRSLNGLSPLPMSPSDELASAASDFSRVWLVLAVAIAAAVVTLHPTLSKIKSRWIWFLAFSWLLLLVPDGFPTAATAFWSELLCCLLRSGLTAFLYLVICIPLAKAGGWTAAKLHEL